MQNNNLEEITNTAPENRNTHRRTDWTLQTLYLATLGAYAYGGAKEIMENLETSKLLQATLPLVMVLHAGGVLGLRAGFQKLTDTASNIYYKIYRNSILI